jgi:uncharacterized DUF497 family protein
MRVAYVFEWESAKAVANAQKHGVTFQTRAEGI